MKQVKADSRTRGGGRVVMRDCSRLAALAGVMEAAHRANQLYPMSRIQPVEGRCSQQCHSLHSGLRSWCQTVHAAGAGTSHGCGQSTAGSRNESAAGLLMLLSKGH